MSLVLDGTLGADLVQRAALVDKLPTGSVTQVVQATNNTQIVINSSSLVTTNIAASITPRSANSKVLVRFLVSVYSGGSNRGTALAMYRGSTQIWYPGGANSSGGYGSYYNYANDGAVVIPIEYLDSPGTTSPVTYTVYAATFNGGSMTFNISTSPNQGQSSAILMEIAG